MRTSLLDISPLRESGAFARLWSSGVVVNIAAQAVQMALAWRVWEETGSSLAVGVLGLSVGLPTVVFSLLGGALADLRPPRFVGTLGVLGQLIVVAGFLVLEATGTLGLLPIYVGVAALSTFGAITAPTRRPYIRHLLRPETIPAASALYMLSMHGGQILGPLLGGLILGLQGNYVLVFVVHLVAVSLYIVAIRLLPEIPPAARSGSGVLGGVAEGLSYVWRTPLVRGAVWLDLCMTLFAVPVALLPELSERMLGGGGELYGALLAAISIGGVSATLLSGVLTRRPDLGRVMVVCALGWAAAVLVLSVSQNAVLALCVLFVMGWLDVYALTAQQSVIQLAVSDEMLGRVGGIQMLTGMGGPQLGNLRAGAMGTWLGPESAIAIGAVMGVGGALIDRKGLSAVWRYSTKTEADVP
ncbi:MFS transporter [Promicromonospora sp. CA-289599]|uniref:MFS transporter n=1 Tax=Promicromonospora sp. CA-289599 TaxID=3240014 RepID=UPI003D8EA474